MLLVLGAMMCGSLPITATGETIRIGGTASAIRHMEILAEAFQKAHPDIKFATVPGLGSGGGRKAVLSGALEIAISAGPLTPAERDQGAVAQEYARTPFVFATAVNSPASDLTAQELVDIYGGKTLTWRDGTRLRLILRPERDTDTAVLRSISPAMAQAVTSAQSRPGLRVAITDHDSVDAIETVPGALGTSTLTLLVAEKRRLKALAINGVAPTPAHIASGAYPYLKSLYLVTRPNPSQPVQEFIAFVRSASGREILVRLGIWVP